MAEMNPIWFYLNEIPYILLWSYFFHWMLPAKKPGKNDFLVLTLTLMGMTAFQLLIFPLPGSPQDQPFLRMLGTWVLYIGLLARVRKAGIKKTVIVWLVHMAVSVTMEILAMLTLVVLLPMIHSAYADSLNMHPLMFILTDFYNLIAYYFVVHYRGKVKKMDSFDDTIVLIVLVASQFFWLYSLSFKLILRKVPDPLLLAVSVLISLFGYLLIVVILHRRIDFQKRRKELELEMLLNAEIQKQCTELDQKQGVIEAIYHELSDLPVYEDQVLESVRDRLSPLRNRLYCDDPAVNAMLNYFKTECDQKEIRFDIEIEASLERTLEAYDLNTLLSNVIKNAIEACEARSDSRIRLSIMKKGGLLRMDCSNSHPSVIKKKMKKLSGQGLPIIEEIVKRYHGTMKFQHLQQESTIQLLLVIEPQRSI